MDRPPPPSKPNIAQEIHNTSVYSLSQGVYNFPFVLLKEIAHYIFQNVEFIHNEFGCWTVDAQAYAPGFLHINYGIYQVYSSPTQPWPTLFLTYIYYRTLSCTGSLSTILLCGATRESPCILCGISINTMCSPQLTISWHTCVAILGASGTLRWQLLMRTT